MRIFDLEGEAQRAARPRGLRPEEPAILGGGLLLGSRFGPTQIQHVNDLQVLGLPAAGRAVNIVSNGVASMSPFDAYAPDGVTKLDDQPLICTRPTTNWGVFDYIAQAVASAMMRGNFVAKLADFDADGWARQAVPAPAEICWAFYDSDGYLHYTIGGQLYDPSEVLHVRGFSLPGVPWGLGMVEKHRRAWGHILEQQHMAADVYSRGAVPTGVMTTDRPVMDAGQAQEVGDQWVERFGRGSKRPAFIPQNWKFQPISWSPEDAQFLQSRQFSVAEIALMADLDPSDLGAALDSGQGSSITYSNIEQKQIARTVDSYGPWMRRFEEAWSDLLPGGNTCRLDPDRLMRMDAKTRAEVNQINITTGVDTVDEIRAKDGKPPLPKPPKPEIDPTLKLAKEGATEPASSATNPDGTTPPVIPAAPGAVTP